MKARGVFLLLAVCIVVADINSKNWVVAALKYEKPIDLLPILRLVYVENTGTAFGLFANDSEVGRWLLVALTGGISIVLLTLLWQAASKIEMAAAALMVGGAVGNIYDRVLYGYVVDFIDAHWQGVHWPAFNVADIAISVGAVLFACVLLRGNSD